MKIANFSYTLVAFASLQEVVIGHVVKRDFASDLEQSIEDAVDCLGCKVISTALKGLAHLGDYAFTKVLTEVCILSKREDEDVCEGLVAAEAPYLAQNFRDVSLLSHTANLLCVNIFGLCDYDTTPTYTIPFPQPKPQTSRPTTSGKTPIQVVHISDTHVDQAYEVGASYNCTKPICCRPYTTADAPGNNNSPAGPYGEHTCDPPISLEKSMYAAINSLTPKPAFTIFTGDVVPHDIWLVNVEEVTTDLDSTTSLMQSLGLVYPATGNHDTAPVNIFPPADLGISPTWAYDTLATDWSKWIGPASAAEAEQFGSYSSVYPGGNLRVISFNSILYYIENFSLYTEPLELDPSGQFAWLVSELQAAETAGQRVWLISHIPSGDNDFLRDYSNYFDQVIQRYEATIAASFYGHTHVDQFQIAYSDYDSQTYSNAVAMSYIAPSMTPTSGSPSFRVYSVDPVTFAVLDFTQYIADIDGPIPETGPVWKEYYSAKAAYGSLLTPPLTDPSAELTPAFWHNVTAMFESNDSSFQDYHARKSRGYLAEPCNGDCKTLEICGLRAAQSEYNCVPVTKGLHFSKRENAVVGKKNECEGSQLRSILTGLTEDPKEFADIIKDRSERYLAAK